MRHYTTVRSIFDAPHQVIDHSICEGRHAHRWTVSATVEGGLDPKKVLVVDHGELRLALDRVVNEVRNRDLNDMLPGVVTTPEGLAIYLRERLVLDWPRLVEVTVDMGDEISVKVESDIR